MRQIAITAVFVSSLVAGCTRATSPSESASSKAPELVARFDPGAGELPEGLVIASDTAYVGFAPTSRVVRVDVQRGTVTAFGELPAPAPGKGFMTGLALSLQGDVYAGLASFTPEIQAGIYRIPAAGGAPERLTRAAAYYDKIAYTRDGSRIMAVAADAPGTSPTRIAGGDDVAVGQPRFAPAGDELAFVAETDGWMNVWTVAEVGGEPTCVFPEPHEHAEPSWGPGQRSFAWAPDSRPRWSRPSPSSCAIRT